MTYPQINLPPLNVMLSHVRISMTDGNKPKMITESEYDERKKGYLIIKKVCDVTGVNMEFLLTEKTRKRRIIMTRNLAVHFMRKYTGLCLRTISMLLTSGTAFDHSTIIHSSDRCQNDIDSRTEKENFYAHYERLSLIFKQEFETV